MQTVTPEGELIAESEIVASSAESAAGHIFPRPLFRGNKGYKATLRAKVYHRASSGETTLTRLYERDG